MAQVKKMVRVKGGKPRRALIVKSKKLGQALKKVRGVALAPPPSIAAPSTVVDAINKKKIPSLANVKRAKRNFKKLRKQGGSPETQTKALKKYKRRRKKYVKGHPHSTMAKKHRRRVRARKKLRKRTYKKRSEMTPEQLAKRRTYAKTYYRKKMDGKGKVPRRKGRAPRKKRSEMSAEELARARAKARQYYQAAKQKRAGWSEEQKEQWRAKRRAAQTRWRRNNPEKVKQYNAHRKGDKKLRKKAEKSVKKSKVVQKQLKEGKVRKYNRRVKRAMRRQARGLKMRRGKKERVKIKQEPEVLPLT